MLVRLTSVRRRLTSVRLRLTAVRRPALFVNAALGVAMLGGAGLAYTSLVQPTATQSSATTRTAPVSQGTVTATVSASGSVRSAATASAEFATAGTVTEILVRVGDQVAKGAVLAKVDPAAAQRQLNAAQANLDAAADAVGRAEDANTSTADAQAQVTQAELAVEEARSAVDGTVLKSPMAGTVVAVNGSVGASSSGSAQGGSTQGGESTTSGFVALADLTKLEVSAAFAESDATKLKDGQAATVTWNALPGTGVAATLASIDPNATTSNNVVTYGVVLSLSSTPRAARPGQTVEVQVTTGEAENAVYVPAAAVTRVGSLRTVTVLADGVQSPRTVEIGLEGDDLVQILSGVRVGELVVLTISSGSTTGGGVFPGGGFTGGGGIPGGGGFPGGGGPPR